MNNHSSPDGEPETRIQDGQILTWSESLGTWTGAVVDGDGNEYHWIEDRDCWVDSDGAELDVVEDGQRLEPRKRTIRIEDGRLLSQNATGDGWVDSEGKEWVYEPLTGSLIAKELSDSLRRSNEATRLKNEKRYDRQDRVRKWKKRFGL